MKHYYEVPKCQCGGELIVERETNLFITNKINKNGTESKKQDKTEGVAECHEWLICTAKDCKNKYELEHDNKGRVIKGEPVNFYL